MPSWNGIITSSLLTYAHPLRVLHSMVVQIANTHSSPWSGDRTNHRAGHERSIKTLRKYKTRPAVLGKCKNTATLQRDRCNPRPEVSWTIDVVGDVNSERKLDEVEDRHLPTLGSTGATTTSQISQPLPHSSPAETTAAGPTQRCAQYHP